MGACNIPAIITTFSYLAYFVALFTRLYMVSTDKVNLLELKLKYSGKVVGFLL